MLKLVYTFFTGLLLATFIGVGIAAFWPAPTYPDCQERVTVYLSPTEKQAETPDAKSAREACQTEIDAHQELMKRYTRNVSIGSGIAAIAFMAVGLALATHLGVLADGFLLGGLFTLLYSIGAGFATEDNKYRFLVVTVGLVIALALGYLKFVKPTKR